MRLVYRWELLDIQEVWDQQLSLRRRPRRHLLHEEFNVAYHTLAMYVDCPRHRHPTKLISRFPAANDPVWNVEKTAHRERAQRGLVAHPRHRRSEAYHLRPAFVKTPLVL